MDQPQSQGALIGAPLNPSLVKVCLRWESDQRAHNDIKPYATTDAILEDPRQLLLLRALDPLTTQIVLRSEELAPIGNIRHDPGVLITEHPRDVIRFTLGIRERRRGGSIRVHKRDAVGHFLN